MKRFQKIVCILAVIVALCAVMTPVANAAENGNLWLSVAPADNGKDTAALILTDTTVTDGILEVTYDPAKLTYKDVLVSSAYVAVHAVNAEQEGTLRISWVAPNAYEADSSAMTLIRINFEGTDGASLEATGAAHDANGTELILGKLRTDSLAELVKAAEALKEEDYMPETWAELEKALEEAKAVLADAAATQGEVDAAAAALKAAMQALGLKADKTQLAEAISEAEALKKDEYTDASWSAVEKALAEAKKVLADGDATQVEVDAATAALNAAVKALAPKLNEGPVTGDRAPVLPVMLIGLLAAAGIAVLFVLRKKDRRRFLALILAVCMVASLAPMTGVRAVEKTGFEKLENLNVDLGRNPDLDHLIPL